MDELKIPVSVAIIPDGNRRWAKKRGLPAIAGHNAGSQQLKKIVRKCRDIGVKYVTFYAFSTENWNREKTEVEQLMKLLGGFLLNFEAELGDDKDSIRIRVIGDRSKLSNRLVEQIERVERATAKNTEIELFIAINYGSRDEILNATKALCKKAAAGEITSEQIENLTEKDFETELYTTEIPDPDLLIRTSGEMRVSNYLLWQLAYSEFYFCDCFWPDFDEQELMKAIQAYSDRKRRFGK